MKCIPAKEAFLGLSSQEAVSYQEAKVVIIPFGLEASVSYGQGTAKGPTAIIQASHHLELFDEQLWCQPATELGIVTLIEPEIMQQPKQALDQLESLVAQVLHDGKFPLVLGGEHTITAGAIKPFSEHYDHITLLHFDAHADLRDSYEANPLSHAATIRRCLDHPNIDVVSIGIRSISSEEVTFLEKEHERIHIYWAKDKARWHLNEIMQHLRNQPVYLTFDLDGFDSSLIPATGTPEPGGLFWQEAIDIITATSQVATIVGADVNELAPIPSLPSCDFLAAKLAYKILSLAMLG